MDKCQVCSLHYCISIIVYSSVFPCGVVAVEFADYNCEVYYCAPVQVVRTVLSEVCTESATPDVSTVMSLTVPCLHTDYTVNI